jgi:hypothetical protein
LFVSWEARQKLASIKQGVIMPTALRPCILAFIAILAAMPSAFAKCGNDDNSIVVTFDITISPGVTRTETTCMCFKGYRPTATGCVPAVPIDQAKAMAKRQRECIQDKGYNLVFGLRDCKEKEPSSFGAVFQKQCLGGVRDLELVLACVVSLKSPLAALAACGLAGIEIPLDASIRCKDIANTCITDALAKHRREVDGCLK